MKQPQLWMCFKCYSPKFISAFLFFWKPLLGFTLNTDIIWHSIHSCHWSWKLFYLELLFHITSNTTCSFSNRKPIVFLTLLWYNFIVLISTRKLYCIDINKICLSIYFIQNFYTSPTFYRVVCIECSFIFSIPSWYDLLYLTIYFHLQLEICICLLIKRLPNHVYFCIGFELLNF